MPLYEVKSIDVEASIEPDELDRATRVFRALQALSGLTDGWLEDAIGYKIAEASAFDEQSHVVLTEVTINDQVYYGTFSEEDEEKAVVRFYDYNQPATPSYAPRLPTPPGVLSELRIVGGWAAQALIWYVPVYSPEEIEQDFAPVESSNPVMPELPELDIYDLEGSVMEEQPTTQQGNGVLLQFRPKLAE